MSELEDTLAFHIKAHKLPEPEREVRWHYPRRWRADFLWIDQKLMVEVEGGTWAQGRHTRGPGFEADCEKYNNATLDGWRVLRVTAKQIDNGDAVDWIRRALDA